MTTENFKILNFYAENVKKLKVVDITPDPANPVVTITGRNGQGKSSILDSILWALGGKDYVQGMPIRQGEEKAMIKLDLGNYIIKRSFTDKGTYLTVENKEGFKTTSPQKILDDMMGQVTFDPLEFMRQDGKKQYETLRNVVSLDVDIDALDAQNKTDFDERTNVNRKIKELEAQIVAYNIPDDTPDELIDVGELSKEIRNIEETERRLENVTQQAKNVVAEIDALEQKIASLRTHGVDLEKQREELSGDPALKKDKQILNDKLENATRINSCVEAKRQRTGKQTQLAEYQDDSKAFTDNIERRKKEKLEALQKAKFPIEGLSFENGTVFYNGVPFEQISTAEQIKISTAIGMSINPRLRVMRIMDGSLLDDDSLVIIKTLAAENDFQVWIEMVKSDDPSAVLIEDGEIVQ